MNDLFEVHYWPTTGRILTINRVSGRTEPILMHVTVASEMLNDATFITALALVQASSPLGELVEHTHDGEMISVDFLEGFQRTVLRAAP